MSVSGLVEPKTGADVFGGRKVIDTDTHLSEPHDLWTSRAPASLRDRVPQVKMLDGKRSWVIDGNIVIGEGTSASSTVGVNGKKWPGLEFLTHPIEDCHPASYSIKERLALMDQLGVTAQILYPNILGFGGQNAAKVDDQLRLASVQIFNDAMAELQADAKGRIYPMALLPWWDVKLAVKEVERTHRMGLRGVNINSAPHAAAILGQERLPDLGQPHWYPLWEACEGLNTPVNFHIGASEQSTDWLGGWGWPGLHFDQRMGIGGALMFLNNGVTLANLLFSGILDRFTKLQFVSVESGIGWIPFILEALDMQYKETAINQGTLQRMPSEYFKTNFAACFWFERKNLSASVRQLGVDNCMFETDFPHPICLYPIDDVDHAMADLTEAEKVKILSGNAERIYNIKV